MQASHIVSAFVQIRNLNRIVPSPVLRQPAELVEQPREFIGHVVVAL